MTGSASHPVRQVSTAAGSDRCVFNGQGRRGSRSAALRGLKMAVSRTQPMGARPRHMENRPARTLSAPARLPSSGPDAAGGLTA